MASAGDGTDESEPEGRDRIVYRSEPDSPGEEMLSTRILMALDSVPRYDAESSETVVFDYVDLDAIDELFSPTNGKPQDGQITFEIDQYEVTATAAGAITVKEKPSRRD